MDIMINDFAFTITTLHITIFIISVIFSLITPNIIKFIKNAIAVNQNNRIFKEKQQQVIDMKDRGELHEWIKMPIGMHEYHVCKKTGYCAEINGFINMIKVKEFEAMLKIEEEYSKFREDRLKELSVTYNIKVDKIYQLNEDIFAIKRDFHVKKLGNLQKKLAEDAKKNETDLLKEKNEI